jgi:hypothetical protein
MMTDQNVNAQPSPDNGEHLAYDNPDKMPRPIIKIDAAHVPPELHFLIPYAEKWGITDDELRHALVVEASVAELEELGTVVASVEHEITKALYFPPLEYTPEAEIFYALLLASGGAGMALTEMRWRKQRLDNVKSADLEVAPAPVRPLAERKAQLLSAGWPDNYPNPRINPAHVPPELHILIPYAKWSIPDRELQRTLLYEAPLAEIEELYTLLDPVKHDLGRFTESRPSTDEPGSYEVGIFDAFLPVLNETFSILDEKMPKRLLELVGWPEAYPGPKLDPAKIPVELHPLIPLAEKWVLSDDVIRMMVLKIASIAELQELVSTINQIGRPTIAHLAVKMTYDETQRQEGYILLLLEDLAVHGEFELRDRLDSEHSSEISS